MFIIGIGRVFPSPTYLYKGIPLSFAAAFKQAIETPNIALAPKLLFVLVPSNSNMALSMLYWSLTSIPTTTGLIFSFTFLTAFNTPLPLNLVLSLSRISRASRTPVDAPDGTHALEIIPFSKVTSTSTVGFPLESSISLAFTLAIFIFYAYLSYKIIIPLQRY